MRLVVVLAAFCAFSSWGAAQSPSPPDPSSRAAARTFFDAVESRFDKDGKVQHFSGEVVAIVGGVIIAADRMTLDREQGLFRAVGEIFVLFDRQLFRGDSISYQLETGDFEIAAGTLVANDGARIRRVLQRVMGRSEHEVAIEAARRQRMQEANASKRELREAFVFERDPGERERMTERYEMILIKQRRIKKQDNAALAGLPAAKRATYEARRHSWGKSKKLPFVRGSFKKGYLYIRGQKLSRTGHTIRAEKAFVTPCRCEDDESPPWGFRASELEAQMGGYADLTHPILEIKGVPVLFLPYLRVPVKEQRQSGFLLPSLSHSRRNGSIFSQSVFLNGGEHRDATVKGDFIEKRGIKLGAEVRYLARRHSGWEIEGEFLRDRLWLSQMQSRDARVALYQEGLTSAAATAQAPAPVVKPFARPEVPSDPEWWRSQGFGYCLNPDRIGQCRDREVAGRLGVPSRPWRGRVTGNGRYSLAPRLSVVATGALVSDHRYLEDIDFESAERAHLPTSPDLFARSRLGVHLDRPNFYLGATSLLGDQATAGQSYSGYQLPLRVRLQSRLFKVPILPVYLELAGETRLLRTYQQPLFTRSDTEGQTGVTLESGSWQRYSARFAGPLVSRGAVTVDHFADLEARLVRFDSAFLSDRIPRAVRDEIAGQQGFSSLRTMRAGLNVNLPLDGEVALRPNPEGGQRMLEHSMNWGVTLSVRPSVVRRGPYGELVDEYRITDEGRAVARDKAWPLVFFPSDFREDRDLDYVADEDLMIPHQRVILSTSHEWSLFDRREVAPRGASQAPEGGETDRERAVRELGAAKAAASDRSLYREVDSGRIRPLSLDAWISYDFRRAKERDELEEAGEHLDLPEPWSPLHLRLGLSWEAWKVRVDSEYHLAKRTSRKLKTSLATPTVWGTELSGSLTLEREFTETDPGQFKVGETRTRMVSLLTRAIPRVKTSASYGLKNLSSGEEQDFLSLKVGYDSPTRCWGLNFVWKKDFADLDRAGTYFLGLVVHFFDQKREFGNLSARMNT